MAALLTCLCGPSAQADGNFLPTETIADLIRSAGSGDPAAQHRLAYRYERGMGGVMSDLKQAQSLYCKAARGGSGDAAYRLGIFYWTGLAVRRDPLQAVSWLARAAQNGSDDAHRLLRRFPDLPAGPLPDCRENGRRPRNPGGPLPDIVRLRSLAADSPISVMIRALAPEFGLDPDLVLAVVTIESNFKPDAVSPRNARGLMQLMPETARRFGVHDPFDPVENLSGGMRYLRWLIGYFQGDLRLALAGYNAGEGAVDRHGGVPPYRETEEYVRRIGRLYPSFRHPVSAAMETTSPVSRTTSR